MKDNNEVKPLYTFSLFCSVIIFLFGFIFIYPSGEIPLADDLSLSFFKEEDVMFNKGQLERADISKIIDIEEITISEPPEVMRSDSTSEKLAISIPGYEINTTTSDENPFIDQPIELPQNQVNALHYFFEGLDSVQLADRQIRILHYGDSQLEGDRITSSLRRNFQENGDFGGCGIGLVPLKANLHGRRTVIQSSSENLNEISFLSGTRKLRYGLLGSVNYFSNTSHGTKKDSLPIDQIDSSVAQYDSMYSLGIAEKDQFADTENFSEPLSWFSLSRLGSHNLKSQQAQNIKLLYNRVTKPTPIKVYLNGRLAVRDIVLPTESFNFKEWPLDESYNQVKIVIEGNKSAEFHGVALDCDKGIAVDNIGLRGAGIMNFAGIHQQDLSNMLQNLNAKLAILQFGVNVVPGIVDDYSFYENMILRQIVAIKKANPGISVLVIGVSDMSRKSGLRFESYPNIEKIRNAQKNAAFKSGSAFWDLYSAMGGKNSMVSWVQNSPPLASSDYTHFNNKGAEIVGKMIYGALMQEYYEYKKAL